jgi:hypothetical protein
MTYLRTDFHEFCDRSGCNAEDVDRVVKAIGSGAWLAGGAVRRTLIGHSMNSDWDFFFKSADALKDWKNDFLKPSS